MDHFEIKFTLAGLNKVIEVLADLPNKSGTFPLLKEIEQQAIAQEKARQQKAEPPEVPPSSP